MFVYSDKVTGIIKLISLADVSSINNPFNKLEVSECPYKPEEAYVKNNQIFPLPAKSFPETTWDLTGETWIVASEVISAKKALLLRDIEKLRIEKESADILYTGAMFQVNQEAQKNISQKLKEVESRIRLNYFDGLELFWLDLSNTLHFWNDANKTLQQNTQDFYDWLSMLQIKATERGTNLYTISWQKKAEVQALQTIEEINSYDINIGW